MTARVDFLGIGATRAGTTWLWNMLRLHPGLWLPPIKELHYFDRSPAYPSPSLFAEARFLPRFFGTAPRHRTFRRLFFHSLGGALLLPRRWQNIPWLLRYLCGTCSDEWYLSLFQTRRPAIKGEITPAYSLLSLADIQLVHALLPGVKLLFLVRNPLERAWSGLRFRHAKGLLDLNDLEQVRQVVHSPSLADRSNYLQTISRWRTFFPAGQLLVCFFDEIALQPELLLARVLEFLQVDAAFPFPADKLSARINAAAEAEMPPTLRRTLARLYLPEVEQMVPVLGGYAKTWLDEIRAMT